MKWYVIHANTGHENKVKRNIEMAVKSNHMEDFFGEVLVADAGSHRDEEREALHREAQVLPVATSWSRW